ncbi:MAG: MBL fold metallo-hydrolase [Minisyncoccota bacterium]
MTQRIESTIGFYGAAGMVTGSNFLFTISPLGERTHPLRIMIDCGLFQCGKTCEEKNRQPFPYDPKTVDVLIITHAHLDHVGRIPRLVKEGFKGSIYSTVPTKAIAQLVMVDSLGVLRKEAHREGKDPLYDEHDVERVMALWRTQEYRVTFDLSNGVSAILHDAGHILGSSMVELSRGDKKIVFTGDLGNSPAPLLHDTDHLERADYLVMEAVYGDREHEDRDRRRALLEDAIEDAVSRGGALVIPAFSIERTQEVLYEINALVEHKKIPEVPVFLDSPLAIKVTDIYKEYESYFNVSATKEIRSGDDIFNFPRLHLTMRREESETIARVPNPKIIIAGSGMSNGGRVVEHHKHYLPDPKSTVLIVGFQAAGTLGRLLQEGAKEVDIGGERIPVRAKIVTLHGYSAHKDVVGLFDFVEGLADGLEKVFIVHAESTSALFFAQRLRDYLGIDAVSPEEGETVSIEF